MDPERIGIEGGPLMAIETEQKREWTNWTASGHDKGLAQGKGNVHKQQATRSQLIKRPTTEVVQLILRLRRF